MGWTKQGNIKGSRGPQGPEGPVGPQGPAGPTNFATPAEVVAGQVDDKAVSPHGLYAAEVAFLANVVKNTDWASKTEGGIIKIALENGVLSITNDGTDA